MSDKKKYFFPVSLHFESPRGALIYMFFLLSLFILLFIFYSLGFRLNFSESMERGLWRYTKQPVDLGVTVLFCPPSSIPEKSGSANIFFQNFNLFSEDVPGRSSLIQSPPLLAMRDPPYVRFVSALPAGAALSSLHGFSAVDETSIAPDIFNEARKRGYIGAGFCPSGTRPLLKQVAAMAGDEVDIGPEGVRVNGQLIPGTKPFFHDSAGRDLPSLRISKKRLGKKEFLPLSLGKARAFDGRYFGVLSVSCILSVMDPIWVW